MKLGPSSGYFGTAAHSMTGLPQAPRQKGRPRKRKPKDIEAMTANLGEWYKRKIAKNCSNNFDTQNAHAHIFLVEIFPDHAHHAPR